MCSQYVEFVILGKQNNYVTNITTNKHYRSINPNNRLSAKTESMLGVGSVFTRGCTYICHNTSFGIILFRQKC